MTDQTRAAEGQFAAVEIGLARLESEFARRRGRPSSDKASTAAVHSWPRSPQRALETGAGRGEAPWPCALLPELRSERVLVLGRILAALGGAGDSSPAVAAVARLWPGVDETAAALRAYAALSSLASGHPRRAARPRREGSRSAPPPSSDATRRRPGSASGRRSTAGSTRVESPLLARSPQGGPGAP